MLDKNILISEVRKLNDSTFDLFEGFPNSCGLACTKWSEALYKYAKDLTPPSSNFETARSECRSILTGICSANSMIQSVTIFINAVVSFCQKISDGILSATFGVLQGVPPIGQPNFLPIFIKAMNGGSAFDFALEFSEEVHNFFLTGTAINVNTGATVNWR